MVIGPDPDAGHQVFKAKGDLEQACIKEAGHQFTQASDTPLLSSPLVDLLGEMGKGSQTFKQILEGTFDPPMACNPFTVKLLRHLYQPPHICDIKPHMIGEYQQGWRKACETTSSLLSSIHFGHYIVGTFNPEILVVNATLADIPLQTSFSPDRWRKDLKCHVGKVTGKLQCREAPYYTPF